MSKIILTSILIITAAGLIFSTSDNKATGNMEFGFIGKAFAQNTSAGPGNDNSTDLGGLGNDPLAGLGLDDNSTNSTTSPGGNMGMTNENNMTGNSMPGGSMPSNSMSGENMTSNNMAGGNMANSGSASSSNTMTSTGSMMSPEKQVASGTTPSNVVCSSGYTLVLNKYDSRPACVTPDVMAKLVAWGWGMSP